MKEPFRFSDGQQANNIEELLTICQTFPQMAMYYLQQGDFENWLNYIGEVNFAQKAQQARESSGSDQDNLQQFLSSCQLIQSSETSANSTPTPTPEPTP
ncbi:MAG TPA: hypothetical protein DCF68_13540, partial [Cyanothece sp. UBA12306]|nr:hypothetical protein [Cyanothece sp. UBA12306]